MKILVAVDDSEFSLEVIRAVVAQFRGEDTEVRVIHVLQPVTVAALPQMAAGYAPELQDEKAQALELIERCANELRRAGFSAKGDVEVGDTGQTIIDAAADWPADLIVIGSHGDRNLATLLLGSVAEFVARHAKCSVQIVRRPAGR
jgi:universal stress protein A